MAAIPTKPSLAFVDDNIHRLSTRSAEFMRELLSEHFEVTYYWDDYFKSDRHVPVEELNKHEYVFFWMAINEIRDLERLTAHLIWAPMFDGFNKAHFFWKLLAAKIPIKVLGFSGPIVERCRQFGIECLPVRYYINPEDYRLAPPRDGKHFFFWYRGHIRFKDIKKIIDPRDVDSFLYRSNPDPSYKRELIPDEDKNAFKMKAVETGYTDKKEYLEALSQSNIFIAPRKKEGVGLAFIEALAMGMVVIGFDGSTMNEYIEDGKNGYLFSAAAGKPIDFSGFAQVADESRKRAAAGYKKWQASKPDIISFVKTASAQKTAGPVYPLYRALYAIERRIPVWKRTFFRYYIRARRKLTNRSAF